MVRILLLTLVLILLVFSPAGAADPLASSLSEIQTAVDTGDLPLFERRVDLPALLDQASTRFVAALSGKAEQLPPALALMAATANSPESRKALAALLAKELGDFVRYGVSSGHFAGKAATASPPGLIAPLLREASLGRKELSLVGTSAPDPKGGRRAQLKIRDHGNDRVYRVDVRFVQQYGGWKAVEIRNLPALMEKIQREAAEEAAHS